MRLTDKMGPRDPLHWEGKLSAARPCHYGEYWQDRYAEVIRRTAMRRIWPKHVYRVLDVGCGDGRVGEWVAREFKCEVTGIDPYDWPGATFRLGRFINGDAGKVLTSVVKPYQYDLALCVTSLPFMRDWCDCVEKLSQKVPRVLVVENLQTPVPPWQKNLPEKEPIMWPDLYWVFTANGYELESWCVANIVDRTLFVKFPWWWARPFVFAVTLAVDYVWALGPHRMGEGRYAAVLWKKPKWE